MARQRCIVGAMTRQADVRTLLFEYPSITNSVADAVTTNVPLDDLPQLIELLGAVDFNQMYTLGFTTPEYMAGYAGQPYYPIPSTERISESVHDVLTGPAETIAASLGTLPTACGWQ
jgi:anionic cell wall polymer biosynthesis LytR-Cps2A-Psr (LCP) family protein